MSGTFASTSVGLGIGGRADLATLDDLCGDHEIDASIPFVALVRSFLRSLSGGTSDAALKGTVDVSCSGLFCGREPERGIVAHVLVYYGRAIIYLSKRVDSPDCRAVTAMRMCTAILHELDANHALKDHVLRSMCQSLYHRAVGLANAVWIVCTVGAGREDRIPDASVYIAVSYVEMFRKWCETYGERFGIGIHAPDHPFTSILVKRCRSRCAEYGIALAESSGDYASACAIAKQWSSSGGPAYTRNRLICESMLQPPPEDSPDEFQPITQMPWIRDERSMARLATDLVPGDAVRARGMFLGASFTYIGWWMPDEWIQYPRGILESIKDG